MGLTSAAPQTEQLPVARAPRSALVLTAAMSLFAALAAYEAHRLGGLQSQSVLVALGIFLALVIGGTVNLDYHYRGQTVALDHFDAALIPALYFLSPAQAVVLAAVAKAICQAQRRVRLVKAAFNVAQWAAAASGGALVFAALHDLNGPRLQLPALALAAAAVFLVNVVAIVLILTLVQRTATRGNVLAGTAAMVLSALPALLLNLSFGILFVVTAVAAPEAAVLLLVPLALLHWASRGYAIGRLEQLRLRMAPLAISALGADADLSPAITNFLAAVGQGLDRESAELLLVGPHGVERWRWGRVDGVGPMEAVPWDEVTPLARALLAVDAPVRADSTHGDPALRQLLRATGHRDVAAAPLPVERDDARPGDDSAVAGVLVLYDSRTAVALPAVELPLVGDLARELGLARERARLSHEVLEERAKMTQIVTETADGIATLDPECAVHTWNPALEHITGYAAEEAIGSRLLDALSLVDPDGRPLSLGTWPTGLDELPRDVVIRTKDGQRRWLSCSYSYATAGVEDADRLIVMARDVTELQHAEARLAGQTAVLELIAAGEDIRRSLQLLADDLTRIEEHSGCAVLMTSESDPTRLTVAALSGVTPTALADLDALRVGPHAGWSGRAVAQRTAVFVDDIAAARDSAALVAAARAHGFRSCAAVPIGAADGDRVLGVVLVLARGAGAHADVRSRAILERAAQLAAVAVTRSQFEAQLSFQATHDPLTGLPNRVVLLSRCERSLATSRDGVATLMMFLDFDRFKLVNDSKGHDAGDQLLIEISARLGRVIRPGDTVSRYGGDEFAILCERVPDEEAVLDLVSRVQGAFTEPFTVRGTELVVTASIGVAVAARGISAQELVAEADAAMYRAKQRGGNRYEVYEATMRSPALLHLETHNALHRALDNGEFIVEYQPIVSLWTDEVIGTEALVRWNHPSRGLLPPDEFMALAESTGLVVPIGSYVTSVALAQAKQWESDGPGGGPIRMNINLSARELSQHQLPEIVAAALERSRVAPESICFEVTETALLYDVAETLATLERLKELGVQLAVDDFGTGYSALAHLRRFPVDGIKIDRSFVGGLDVPRDRAIVRAVIELARDLGISVVAEGVETERQIAVLKELGCEAAQGYLLSVPRPAAALTARWAAERVA